MIEKTETKTKKDLLPRHRLPSNHPEFLYLPSTNPYWHKIKALNGPVFLDSDGEKHREQWREYFSKQLNRDVTNWPLRLEIGCNGGHWLLDQAERASETLFLGIDWKFKQIFLANEKAQKRGLRNIGWLRAYAQRLKYLFGENELDDLFLFFPDPWPKRAQQKNRLFSKEWLDEIAPLLKPSGRLEVRTDHPEYFQRMIEEAEQTEKWEILEKEENYHLRIKTDTTLFEKIFIEKGLPIGRLILRKSL